MREPREPGRAPHDEALRDGGAAMQDALWLLIAVLDPIGYPGHGAPTTSHPFE